MGRRPGELQTEIAALLENRPHTSAQLAQAVGHSDTDGVNNALRALRRDGRARVADWTRTGARQVWCPIYGPGPGDDAPVMAAESRAASARTRRERQRLQPLQLLAPLHAPSRNGLSARNPSATPPPPACCDPAAAWLRWPTAADD